MPRKVTKPQQRALTKRGSEWILHRYGYELVESMLAEGFAQKAVARQLGIDPKTFREIRKRDPELEAAVDRGLAKAEKDLVDLLMEAARGGNVASAMFLLKTRHGYREQGPVEGSAVPQVNIVIPPKMSAEDFRVIDGTAKDVTSAA